MPPLLRKHRSNVDAHSPLLAGDGRPGVVLQFQGDLHRDFAELENLADSGVEGDRPLFVVPVEGRFAVHTERRRGLERVGKEWLEVRGVVITGAGHAPVLRDERTNGPSIALPEHHAGSSEGRRHFFTKLSKLSEHFQPLQIPSTCHPSQLNCWNFFLMVREIQREYRAAFASCLCVIFPLSSPISL